MTSKDEKLQQLTDVMLAKLSDWRKVADQVNGKNSQGIAPTGEEIDAYFESDKAYMKAKSEWENRLRELYQS